MNSAYTYLYFRFVQQLFQQRIHWWRLSLAITISSFMAVVFFYHWYGGLLSYILAVIIAYVPHWGKLVKQGVVLLFIGCFISGFLTFMQSLFYMSLASYLLIGLALIVLLILQKILYEHRLQQIEREFLCDVELQLFQQSISLKAFYDSGNRCIEPLSGQPVHFLAFSAVTNHMPQAFIESLLQWNAATPFHVSMFPYAMKKQMRFIRIHTVEGSSVVLAFRVQLTIANRCFSNHYVVLTKQAHHFPQQAQLILHCSTEF